MLKDKSTFAFLAALTVVALFFCYQLIAPFLKPIIFSAIVAISAYPAHVRIHSRIRNQNAAAAASTTIVVLLITTASILLGHAIVSGLTDVYRSLSNATGTNESLSVYLLHLIERAAGFVSRYIPVSGPDVQTAITEQAKRAVSALLSMSAGALGSLTSLFGNALTAFFVLFFLFRDGESMLHRVAEVIPLTRDQATGLYVCAKETLNAILYGTIAIALLQGALTGLGFFFVGLGSPVLWGIVAGVCSLLPVVGTAAVFLPAISMLAFTAHWVKATVLLVWAIIIVNPVDNVLRPYLIGGRTKLSTLFVFFALLGGLETFGPLGIFLGPVILALTMALFKFLKDERYSVNWNLASGLQTTVERAETSTTSDAGFSVRR